MVVLGPPLSNFPTLREFWDLKQHMRMGLAILNHGLDYARLVGLTYHNRTSYNAAFNSLSPFLLHMVTKSFKKLGDFVNINSCKLSVWD